MSPIYRDAEGNERPYASALVLRTLIWAIVVIIAMFLAWRFAAYQGWVG